MTSATLNESDFRWISVDEDLPSNSAPVLVAYNGQWKPNRRKHWAVLLARYSGGAWRFVYGNKTRQSDRVRFWMRMPSTRGL